MKVVKLALAFACLLALALPAFGQQADESFGRGIPGYLDPSTGAFKVMPSAGGEANPDAVTTVGGKIVTTFTINVQSAIAATESGAQYKPLCSISLPPTQSLKPQPSQPPVPAQLQNAR